MSTPDDIRDRARKAAAAATSGLVGAPEGIPRPIVFKVVIPPGHAKEFARFVREQLADMVAP
jgi:hypothetical protein